MVASGVTPRRSFNILIASSSPVPCTEKKIGSVGCNASIASMTPWVITSVRAKAPQKLMTRLLMAGFDSSSSSAGFAWVYDSPPISRKFAGRPP